ncbi:MAG: DUF3800 domain-containing protein [Chloroflexi bacterium]|nr:DUF3800 domain-containing protein [Chloroflexota bacterium]
MVFVYIDESGTGINDNQTRVFVLSGIVVRGQDWHDVDEMITNFKQRLFQWALPEDWEIKGREIRRGNGFFSSFNWEERLEVIREVAVIINKMPCQLYAVRVDKAFLTKTVTDEDELYRMAFWRLLDLINDHLNQVNVQGMIFTDSRTDMHRDIKDRRLIASYREWARQRKERVCFLELPWFGFSSFYTGLQLADFASYMISVMANDYAGDSKGAMRASELALALGPLQTKARIIEIP